MIKQVTTIHLLNHPIMPWTIYNYPASMKNLPELVRMKAIEIANAMLEENKMEEGLIIATAISRAKKWVKKHYPTLS